MRITRLCAVLLVAVFASGARGQAGGPLGPKDGRDLPPTDLARVNVGVMAPDFTLESMEGRRVTLSGYRGKRNVVLVFYRGHW